MSDSLDFLVALWDGLPQGPAVQVWTRVEKKTHCFNSLRAASDFAESVRSEDVYIAAGLAPKYRPPYRGRAKATEVVGIPGMWADIDVNGGPDNKQGAAPNQDAALELARSILEPTVLVNSGHGLQAWWLFEDGPWVFGSEAERTQAERLASAFQAALRGKAAIDGFNIDSTHDLARLMRLPGTFNHKGIETGHDPAPVEMLADDGPRFSLETFGNVAESYMGEAVALSGQAARANVSVEVRPTVYPPIQKLDLLMTTDPDFEAVWRRRKTAKSKDWSMSEFEMSVTCYLVNYGWEDQEIADTLVYYRNMHEPGDPRGKNRPARIAQTIAKARTFLERDEMLKEAEFEREQAVDALAHIGKAVETEGQHAANRTQAVTLFSRIIGGPPIKDLVQDGRDPDTARFRLELEDGREVPLGKIDVLADQKQFRKVFGVVTSHYPRSVKSGKWDEIVQGLMASATVNEGKEDTRGARVKGWLENYLARKLSSDKNAACRAKDPWEDKDSVYVPLDDFRQHLRKLQGERIEAADLKLYMEAAGFERRTINYMRDDSTPSSRSYYVLSKEHLEVG